MNNLLIVFTLFSISFSAFGGDLYLDIDRYACADDFLSMSIDIEIGDESFSFSEDCGWSFSSSLETESGISCDIEGNMCDNRNDFGSIEVNCDNGDWEEETFPCNSDDI